MQTRPENQSEAQTQAKGHTETQAQEWRRLCARRAVNDCVHSGDKLGLGTGRTASYAAECIAEKLASGDLSDIAAVPTSSATRSLCQRLGIPVLILNHPSIAGRLAYTIDSADEVNPELQLIKGGGGAHLIEKIVEYNSDKLIIIVDESKLVNVLNKHFPLPLEVIPEACASLVRQLQSDGFRVSLRLQNTLAANPNISLHHLPQGMGGAEARTPNPPSQSSPTINLPPQEAFRTDSGNYILDLSAPGGMEQGGHYDPQRMEAYLKGLTGVVESGLFTRGVDRVYVAGSEGVRILP